MQPESNAQALLERLDIKRPPVPVEAIAADLGIEVVFKPFDGDNVSGMLFRDEETSRVVIGVNSAHSTVRQRFTIAHELGHFELHPGKPTILDHVVRVNFRDKNSNSASDKQEKEANRFAAYLLMPTEMVEGEVHKGTSSKSLADSELVDDLASVFHVSGQAMGIRLSALGLTTQA